MTMIKENIITELQDYMFTSDNLGRFTKHMIQINLKPKQSQPPTCFLNLTTSLYMARISAASAFGARATSSK